MKYTPSVSALPSASSFPNANKDKVFPLKMESHYSVADSKPHPASPSQPISCRLFRTQRRRETASNSLVRTSVCAEGSTKSNFKRDDNEKLMN